MSKHKADWFSNSSLVGILKINLSKRRRAILYVQILLVTLEFVFAVLLLPKSC